jgi:hypothetical protein
VSKERRDRRKKKLVKVEQGKETREAQAAQATTLATSVHDDEDEETEAVNTVCAVPIEEGEQQTESVMGMEGEERAAAQQEGEDRVMPTMTTEDARVVVETSLEEVPETVVDEHEQTIPAYVDSGEEEDEIISLAQQPEVEEEAASDARLMSCRG